MRLERLAPFSRSQKGAPTPREHAEAQDREYTLRARYIQRIWLEILSPLGTSRRCHRRGSFTAGKCGGPKSILPRRLNRRPPADRTAPSVLSGSKNNRNSRRV